MLSAANQSRARTQLSGSNCVATVASRIVALLGVVTVCQLCGATEADDEAAAVCARWKAWAGAVQACRLEYRGEEGETGGLRPLEVEYVFSRDRRERLARRGPLPNPRGIGHYDSVRVWNQGQKRKLSRGHPEGALEYDTYQISLPKDGEMPIEMLLLPLQVLFQHPGLPTEFRWLESGEVRGTEGIRQVSGQSCRALEHITRTDRVTVWYAAETQRIYRIEDEGFERGRGVYEFTYDESPEDSEFLWPRAVTAQFAHASGTVWATGRCEVTVAQTNPRLASDTFEIPIPTGALICDFTQSPVTYFLQLPDGTQRPLTENENSAAAVMQLSSEIPGSRVYRVRPRLWFPPNRRPALLLIGNLVAVLLLLAYWRWRSRSSH